MSDVESESFVGDENLEPEPEPEFVLPPPDEAPPEYTPQWSAWTRRAVTVGLVIAGVYALTLLAPVFQVLIGAFLMAFLMYLPARFITDHTRLRFQGSVGVVYLFMVLFIILFIVTFLPGFAGAVNSVVVNIQTRYIEVRKYLREYEPGTGTLDIAGREINMDAPLLALQDLINQFDPPPPVVETPIIDLNEITGQSPPINLESAAPAIQTVTALLTGTVSSIGSIFTTLFLSIFLSFLILIDLPRYQHTILENVPRDYRREMMLLMEKIYLLWMGFFRGQGIIAVIIGVVTWVQLTLMGVPQANVLAVFTALISLIPTIGGIIALIPLALVPLLQGSSTMQVPNGTLALAVVGINFVISQIIWNAIAPRILGNLVALPVPVIILGVVIGAALGGVLGAFLIVPILGSARLIVVYMIAKIGRNDPFPEVPRDVTVRPADL